MNIDAHQRGADLRSLRLTPSEEQVLPLLATHLTMDAIAERLERKRSTIKTHVAHIYRKLGACNRGEAIARAREAGLLADPDAGSNPRSEEAPTSDAASERSVRWSAHAASMHRSQRWTTAEEAMAIPPTARSPAAPLAPARATKGADEDPSLALHRRVRRDNAPRHNGETEEAF